MAGGMDGGAKWIDHPVAKIAACMVMGAIIGLIHSFVFGHYYQHLAVSLLIGAILGFCVFGLRKPSNSN